jgi:hypothetical protein
VLLTDEAIVFSPYDDISLAKKQRAGTTTIDWSLSCRWGLSRTMVLCAKHVSTARVEKMSEALRMKVRLQSEIDCFKICLGTADGRQ